MFKKLNNNSIIFHTNRLFINDRMSTITTNTEIYVDSELVDKVKKDLIDVSYYNDIKFNIKSKSFWKAIADITETLSQIFTVVSTIFAFSAGFFNHVLLSFIAGCLGTSALILLKFSSYATKESRERTQQVNMLLEKLGITEIPDITSVVTDSISNVKATKITTKQLSLVKEKETIIADNVNLDTGFIDNRNKIEV